MFSFPTPLTRWKKIEERIQNNKSVFLQFFFLAFCSNLNLQLHLDVLDANEFAPVFGHDQYEVSVPENIGSGKKILQLDVTDRDVTSRLFYSISSTAHPDSKSRFKINSDTGEIYVRNPLDHEGIRQHILTVKVRDVGHISFHSFTTVVVTVLDFNDHMPYFGADHYEGQVFETAETGTVVVHVQGYDNDKDVNAELEYSILSGERIETPRMIMTPGVILWGVKFLSVNSSSLRAVYK